MTPTEALVRATQKGGLLYGDIDVDDGGLHIDSPDDLPSFFRNVQAALASEGYVIVNRESLAAALERCEGHTPMVGHSESGPVDEYGIPELRSVTDYEESAAILLAAIESAGAAEEKP